MTLSKLYEKTILIAQEHKANSDTRAKIIKNQQVEVNIQRDTATKLRLDNANLNQENKTLKSKVKIGNLRIIILGLVVVFQTYIMIKP